MGSRTRGADVLARTLARAGVRHLFSLSGNHVMPVYDAALDAGLSIVHVRHEGAAVHMADAWGRLTGEPGVALLTGGPGHANGVGALYTALAAESPMVLLSGHAPLHDLGKGAFQEMEQERLASPVCKASWTAAHTDTLAADVSRALSVARAGRPGPVHLSLPLDLLEAGLDDEPAPAGTVTQPASPDLTEADARAIVEEIAKARHPLVITGPALAWARGRNAREALSQALGCPVVAMESPRGVADPALGAFAEVLRVADLVVLLGKRPDFTLRYAGPAAIAPAASVIAIDPEPEALERARRTLGARTARFLHADTRKAMAALCAHRAARAPNHDAWIEEVSAAINYRPAEWAKLSSGAGPLHPVEVGRAVQEVIDRAGAGVLVGDGGEFGQWAQACVSAPTRLINGPAGSIGSAIPFALAARLAEPNAPVIAMLGDGTFGFHPAEFDTAVRHKLPFVAVVGNDACWNAEYQIQLREYGAGRARGCELLPAAYDAVAAAFGGHGERVQRAGDLLPALERALASGRPACVNVAIERVPAPVIARPAPAPATAAAHEGT